MNGETVNLQANSGTNSNKYGADYSFVLDTCSRLQSLTGAQCAGADAEAAALEHLKVTSKVSTEFFDPESYVKNDQQLSSVFDGGDIFLKGDASFNFRYTIQLNQVRFKDNEWYNPTLIDKHNYIDYYSV